MANRKKPVKSDAEAEATSKSGFRLDEDTAETETETRPAPPSGEHTGGIDTSSPSEAAPETLETLNASEDTGDEVAASAEPLDAGDEQFDARPAEAEHPQIEKPTSVVTTEQVIVRQGGFWSMLFGGALAAGIGVIAAPYLLPPQWLGTDDSEVAARLEQGLAAQDQRLTDLSTTIERLDVPSDVSGEIGGLSETLTALTGQLSALEGRIMDLESRPSPETGGTEPSAAIEELRAMLAAQRADLDALQSDAKAADAAARDSALATLRRAALTRILTALDSGSDFSAALADLRETGVNVSPALADMAETGVPTQAVLVERFPDAARAALAMARKESGAEMAGVSGFLKSQLGLRSLTPRDGDDPDAVLSRVEAALSDGRLGDALAEIDSLPEGARAALSDWTDLATRRKAALAAAEDLAGTLN